MTLEEVQALRTGDEVFWHDPDEGECSRYIVIHDIEIKGETVCIWEWNGYLECFAEELE